MKLKVLPADFQVTEVLDVQTDPRGEYHVHRLRKEKSSTQDAIARIARLARVPREDIAFAGLKDRQGRTEQWLSIRGKRVDHHEPGLHLSFVCRSAGPVTSKQSRGNRFRIVVRDLLEPTLERARREAEAVRAQGLPNYFDDQRFGCLRHGQGFAMAAILRGDHEQALHRLLARPSPVALGGDRRLKELLDRHWGDWERCAAIARGPVFQPALTHLVRHPDDFEGALAKLPARQRLIHAFAYQSFLWNRSLSRFLFDAMAPRRRRLVEILSGRHVVWEKLTEEQLGKLLDADTPLFGPRGHGGSPAFRRATMATLAEADHRVDDFLDHEVPGMVLVEEPRAALVRPLDLEMSPPEPDPLHAGRVCSTLRFQLPRGAYATLVIKRLFSTMATSRAPGGQERTARGDSRRPRPRPRDRRSPVEGGRRPPRRRDEP